MTIDPADGLRRRIDDTTARVVVIGQGYVGLPVAIRAAAAGFRVIGFDTDAGRIASLAAGTSYVEDVSHTALAAALAAGYRPSATTDDLAGFDIAVITVPTPLHEGAPDLSHIESSARVLAEHLPPGALVVLESTTYPGTTEELLRPLLETCGRRAERDFFLGYSPERVDPGNPTWNLVNTPKIVSGSGPRSLELVAAFYGHLVERVVPVASTGEAELVKLLENTFRHVNIALVNELAVFAHQLGLDIWSAIDAAATKPFGFQRFTPGPGVGGHCLPIDPSYLAWRVERRLGHRFRFVELANDVNQHMPDYVVARITALLNQHGRSVRGARILLCGLAYKAGTSDSRESPSAHVARQLLDLGADLRVHDDHVPPEAQSLRAGGVAARRVACDRAEIVAADLVVILVDHPDLPLDDIADHARLVLDTKAALRGRRFVGELL